MIFMLGSFSCQCHSEYYLNVTTKNCDFRLHQQISDEHFFLIMAYSNSDIKDPYRIYHQEKRPIGPIWGAPGRPGWDLSLVGDEIWRSEKPLIDFHVNPKLPPTGFIVEESRILYTKFTSNGGKVIFLIFGNCEPLSTLNYKYFLSKSNLYEILLLLRLFSKPQISSLKAPQSTGKVKFCIFPTSRSPPKMAELTLHRQISLLELSIFRNSDCPIFEPIIPDRSYLLEYFIISGLWRNLFL